MLAAEACLHPADALIRNPLHQTDCAHRKERRGEQAVVATTGPWHGQQQWRKWLTVKLDLVPLNDGPLNLEEWQADRRLPVLGALENEVVERVTDLAGVR